MGDYQYKMNKSRWEGDLFTRNRFKQHQRSTSMENLGGRSAEYTAARQSNKNMSEADETMWHNYVHGKGDRPGGYGGGYGGNAPTMGEAPTLNLPEYDEDKVSELTQKRAAPGVRRLRETTQQAMGETYENPNVKRMTVREALSGYGSGLENVMAGAGSAATQEYGQQYAASVSAEMARFQGALSRQSQEYDVSSRDWLMGRQKYWEEEYEDPYDAFNAFYS
ncbi:MAG TPA: hypothetical protein VMW25_01555 [Clostridia bacterium]|nr:hypothetical protein [Clostridia bacterium]